MDLIVSGHGVEIPIGPVQINDSPPPLTIRAPLPPRVRGRLFPDDGLAPVVLGDVAEGSKVDLVYRDGHLLVGTVAGTSVQLDVVVPAHDATASGSFADVNLHATRNRASNSTAHPDVPGSLTGSYAGQPVTVRAVFHLDDDHIIDYTT